MRVGPYSAATCYMLTLTPTLTGAAVTSRPKTNVTNQVPALGPTLRTLLWKSNSSTLVPVLVQNPEPRTDGREKRRLLKRSFDTKNVQL